jgi:putative membrane protein insertion efficiency factor
MISKTTLIITISYLIISIISTDLRGQDKGDLVLLQSKFNSPPTSRPTYIETAKRNRNEVQIVFAGLFLFYKGFVSSQDSQKCVFHPSCSEYGMLAVKQFGALKGMALTFDRLSRCNALSPQKYQYDPTRNVLLDPVTNE